MKNFIMIFIGLYFASFSAIASVSIDLEKSQFKWEGGKKVVNDKHFGEISLKSAEAEIKDGKIISGTFIVDMNTIEAKDFKKDEVGKKKRLEKHLKSKDFFDVKVFQTATLKINKQVGENKVVADFTLKGQTHPVEINFSKKNNSFTGVFVFDRTKWGIIYGSSLIEKLTVDKIIKDEIKINFKVVISKKELKNNL